MLDENQYEEFRFVGLGEKAAVKQFAEDVKTVDSLDGAKAQLEFWKNKESEYSDDDKHEEVVYALAHARKMQALWKAETDRRA